MSMQFTDILKRAMETESHVRVYRELAPTAPLCGYVAAVGKQLFAMHIVGASVRFDGMSVIRIGDLSEIRTHGDGANFTKRALAARGLSNPTSSVDVSSWRAAIETTISSFPIALFQNIIVRDGPEESWTKWTRGSALSIDDDAIAVRTIDDGGIWQEPQCRIPLKSIVRMDYGGVLNHCLGELAQDP